LKNFAHFATPESSSEQGLARQEIGVTSKTKKKDKKLSFMKYLLFFLLLLTSFATAQQQVEPLDTDNLQFESGKCYAAARLDRQSKNPIDSQNYILEILHPQIEKYKSKISQEELAQYNPDLESYQIKTRDAYLIFKFKNELLNQTSIGTNGIGYVVCVVEEPPIFQTISKEVLLNKNTIIERFKIKGKPQLIKKIVEDKPTNLSDNQFYLPFGNWTKIREMQFYPSCGGLDLSIIQKKLISLGYDLKINKVVDEKFKAAILDFQRKNGLKEGQLDLETMKALGVNY